MSESTYPTIYALPREHCELIGQFITRWAYLEWRLHEAMYALVGIGPKLSRVVLREPRVVDYLTMIQDAARLKDVTIAVDWAKLKTIMREIESWRDRFAHGIWLDVPGTDMPAVQVLSGKTVVKKGGPATSARIEPKGFRVSIEELQNAINGIDAAVRLTDEMKDQIERQT